jgi:hypothetical protein
MGVEPNGALLAFSAFSVAGAALGSAMVLLLGVERYRLFVSLRRGDDLTARRHQLHRSLAKASRTAPAQAELQLLCSIISMEHADLSAAEQHLADAHVHAAVHALHARLQVLRGTFSSNAVPTASGQLGRLGELIDVDTAAQIELRSHRVPQFTRRLLPTTRARVLAAQQKHDEALAVLRTLAPSRVDAMCALFPDDPATRLWLARSGGPYR